MDRMAWNDILRYGEKKQSDTENLLKREPACGNLFAWNYAKKIFS